MQHGGRICRRISGVVVFAVFAAGATVLAAPAPQAKAIPAACDGSGPILAGALPRRVPPSVCDLVDRTIRDGRLKATVPPPGRAIYVEGLATNGYEEFTIKTAEDGTVTFEHVGSETEPPPNDNFGDPQSASSPASLPATNVGATTEFGEDVYCYNEATVWYSFTAPKTARYRVGVLNPAAGLDGVLGVYQGDSPSTLSTLDCVDRGFAGDAEKTSLQATAGETYRFQVGSYPGSTPGTFTFSLEEVVPPPNDGFAGAVPVSDLPFEHTTTFEGASETLEPNEPQPSCAPVRGTLWYRFQPDVNLEMTAAAFATEAGTSFGVYEGTGFEGLQEVACSSWGDPTSFDVTSGDTYYIQVGADEFSELVGDVTVTLDGVSAPLNEHFAAAITAKPLPFTHSVSINSATIEPEPGEPQPSCNDAEATIWYRITPSDNMRLTADVISDSSGALFALYKGSALTDLTELTCSRFGSPQELRVFAGHTYYAQVGAMAGQNEGGTLTFGLDGQVLPPPPGHDDFADAAVVGGLPYTDTFESSGGTTQPGEPGTGCGQTDSSAWYRFVPSSTNWVAAKVARGPGDDVEPIVAAYRGSSLTDLNRLGCDGKKVVFNAKRGATYYLQVARGSDFGSQITFSLEKTVSPYEPCLDCKPACEDDSSALLGFFMPGTYKWRFNKSTRPRALTARQTLSAIRSGVSTIVKSGNDCKLADRVGARESYKGDTGRRANLCTSGRDGVNVIDFGPLGGFIIGYSCSTWEIKPGPDRILESDIRLNKGGTSWTVSPTKPGCSDKIDLQSVVAHEAGHTFGLDHSNGRNLTMYPTVSACTPALRTLGLGDVRGLRRLY